MRLFIWFILGLILSCNSVIGQSILHEKMSTWTKHFVESESFQGTVLVAKHGTIIYQEAFGFADLGIRIPNTLETKFLIGSTTKSFTAATILQLVEEGLLDLHIPIGKYLPDIKEELATKLTIHHLLKMQSGLPDHLNRIADLKYEDIESEELIQLINRADLSYDPGNSYNYSNINYALLATIIERVTEKTFPEILKEKTFQPLKMENSGVERTNDMISLKAKGYSLENEIINPSEKNYMAYAVGSGDIYSTIGDLLKWDQALYTKTYLSEHSKEIMFDAHSSEEFGHYGYGFKVQSYVRGSSNELPGKLVRHGGSMQGYLANIHRYLDDEITVIVLGNIRPFSIVDLTFGLKEILFGRPAQTRDEAGYKY